MVDGGWDFVSYSQSVTALCISLHDGTCTRFAAAAVASWPRIKKKKDYKLYGDATHSLTRSLSSRFAQCY